MAKQFKVGDRVCVIQEDVYKQTFVNTIVKVNEADRSVIKLNNTFNWILSVQVRYATEKEIKEFELKNLFIKKA
jgi:hypothetical protein